MIKKLCVLSLYFPSEKDPHYAFVGTLVSAIADIGIECHVITPVSCLERKHRAVSRVETTPGGAKIHVHCPRFFGLPSWNRIRLTYRLTAGFRRKKIKKVFDSEIGDCDAIYSHFLKSGVDAGWLSAQTGIPAFVAIGESNLQSTKLCRMLYGQYLTDNIKGVVSVSSALKQEARQMSIFSETTPIEVFPNSIDNDLFVPRDKAECREKLGIGKDDFVISFVGAFIPRKGLDKLQEAISRHPNWKCILIGAGELPVTLPSGQVVFNGRIPHDRIPECLCAADVFALPTKAEGCCNAIVEAMGCGLPIVSSDRPFNDDILDETNSIRIDPESVDAIEQALVRIERDHALRDSLAAGALQKGKALSIGNRAAGIAEFMEKHL